MSRVQGAFHQLPQAEGAELLQAPIYSLLLGKKKMNK